MRVANVIDREVKMVVVTHVDDIRNHAKDQATMERFAAELGKKFKLKDMEDAKYYMGYHTHKEAQGARIAARSILRREVYDGKVRR